jgi:hypothetical protein
MMESYTAKFEYPGVIKQGDKSIDGVLIAKARLVRA